MRLTPRRRAVIAIIVALPVGYLYLDFGFFTALNLLREWRNGYVTCDGSWRSFGNDCASYSATVAIVELLITTAIVLAIAFLLARWIVQPLRQVAEQVSRFGPNSLGLRVRADGPRDETRELAEAIDGMLDRLAEGYEAQRRFASNASHELRTPLATQRALIEVSLASALTPDQLELLSRQLLATNERNEALIDGLLTLAETERGVMVDQPQRLDELAHESVVMWQHAADQAGVEVSTDLVPVSVAGERPLLERLVGNLVQNAIKYNHPGGTVRVSVSAPGLVTVANTGPVVPAEQAGVLFEPFRRLSGERLDHGGGAGLGLTIARSIVAAHGGSISARANPDGGLTVEARLRPA